MSLPPSLPRAPVGDRADADNAECKRNMGARGAFR